MNQQPVLAVTGLTKYFGNFVALENFSLSLFPGEIFGILGPNGAGKSTILRCLSGLIFPTSGEIVIDGYSLKKNHRAALSQIGCLIEAPAFYSYLSGRKNLELLLRLCSQNPPEKSAVNWALDLVKLTPRAEDAVKKYSQGMKQRLGIAAALLTRPKIVLLDEPTNGLDPEGQIEMRHLIKSLARENQMTFLFSSHLLSEIEQLCDRIVILNQGKTIAIGNVAELIRPDEKNLEQLFLRLIQTQHF